VEAGRRRGRERKKKRRIHSKKREMWKMKKENQNSF
jgi:hypothetical protein